jgi:hypothetical protein
MAVAKVVEFANVAVVGGTAVAVGEFDDSTKVKTVTYTTTTQSDAFRAHTKFITITAKTDGCYFKIGSNPTATAGDGSDWLPGDASKSFFVTPGQKVAFYDGTS